MEINTYKYITNYLYIKTKEGELKLLQPNPAQQMLYEKIKDMYNRERPIRIVILKSRQLGFSTMVGAVFSTRTMTEKHITTSIVAHEQDATNNLYNMYKTYYNNLPEGLKPQEMKNNAKELVFNTPDYKGLDSKIRCMTANDEGTGRSGTNQYLHISEYAFWKGEKRKILNGLLATVPNTKDSMVIIESTANGYEDFREIYYQAANNTENYGWEALFVGWNLDPSNVRPAPINMKLDEEEEKLKEQYNLTNEQIQWRREKLNEYGGDLDYFHQEYPINPEEAFISSGQGFFNIPKVMNRMAESLTPKKYRIDFKYNATSIYDIDLIQDYRGEINIYKLPEKRHPYVIGVDTAGEGSDYNVAQVIDNITGEQVATYRTQTGETEFCRQIYALGSLYNWAMLSIETNFSTYCVNKLSEDYEYPHLYVRERVDTYTKREVDAYGWRTTTITRPLALDQLKEIVKEHIMLLNDKETLLEMTTFIKNEKGKPEALKGYHDDLIMALAIGYASRLQYSTELLPDEKEEVEEEEDNGGVYEWLS